jgi:hypothetical protein
MEDFSHLKMLAYKCFQDKTTKMSIRVACVIMYGIARVGDMIDWVFPVRLPVTTMEDARRVWGDTADEEALKSWVQIMNKRKDVVVVDNKII